MSATSKPTLNKGTWDWHAATPAEKEILRKVNEQARTASDSEEENEKESEQQQQPKGGGIDNMELPAMFWDEMPENAEQHPDFQAMEALKAECTPEERANTAKVNGNKKLQMGVKVKNKVLLREAADLYTKGLAEKANDAALNSMLLSNRAHAESLLGNWRKTLRDGIEATKLDETNVKAYFRGARAALKLGEFEQCQELCAKGRKHAPLPTTEFDELEKEAATKAGEVAAAKQKAAEAEAASLLPSKVLAQAIASRGIKLTAPQVRTESDQWRPTLEEDGSMSWPVVMAYPEAGMAQDTIEDFHESALIAQHLDVMFAPDAPPLEWDSERAYTRDRVQLFYLSNAGKPLSHDQLVEVLRYGRWPSNFEDAAPNRYGAGAPRWREVDERWSLRELLSQPDYIVPGAPLLWVVARDTDYHARLLQENE